MNFIRFLIGSLSGGMAIFLPSAARDQTGFPWQPPDQTSSSPGSGTGPWDPRVQTSGPGSLGVRTFSRPATRPSVTDVWGLRFKPERFRQLSLAGRSLMIKGLRFGPKGENTKYFKKTILCIA